MNTFLPTLRKQLPFILLLSLVYLGYFITHPPVVTKPEPILGAHTNLTLFTQPESGREFLLEKLDGAQKEILLKVYLLSDKDVIASLIRAKVRGVHVVVMLEEHPFGGGNLNSKTEKELKDAGVDIGWTSPDFPLSHEKSVVIDQTYVFILNQNLTTSSFTKNREYNILDTNPEDVQEVRKMFIADWERKSYTASSSSLLISPLTARSGIEDLIRQCTKTIDIEIEILTDDTLTQLLGEQMGKCAIRVITPTFTQISSNKESMLSLRDAGGETRVMSSPYIHAKLVIIDGKKAYIGSINFSSQSIDENRELGIVITDPSILQELTNTFEMDWNNATSVAK